MDETSLASKAASDARYWKAHLLQEAGCQPFSLSPSFARKSHSTGPSLHPLVYPANCVVLHGALSQPESQLLKAMSAVLSPNQALPRLRLYPHMTHEAVKDCLNFWDVGAIWLLGESVAQFFLKTQEMLSDLLRKPFLFVDTAEYRRIPVLISQHPRDILDNVRAKKRIYQDLLQFKTRLGQE